MAKISKENSLGNLHPRENIWAAGNLAAVNAEVVIDADGASTVTLVVTGVYVGTLTVEGSADGTNWDVIPIKPVNAGGIYVLTLASAAVGRFVGAVGWARKLRVRASAFTSGAASIHLSANNGVIDITALPRAADQGLTITAAAGVAATLTLPAAGIGLFHYITRLVIQRHAAALLVAAATPVIVTSTNLAGAMAFSTPADAAPAGSVYNEPIAIDQPMRSSAANTATTIVAPIVTNGIWRISANWYNGV